MHGVPLAARTFALKNGQKITIRRIAEGDIERAKEFMEYINEIVAEDADIHLNGRQSLADEKEWLDDAIEMQSKCLSVVLVAESGGNIAGVIKIDSKSRKNHSRQNHVAVLGMTVKKDFREIGVGTELITAAIDEARKTMKPKPSVIELEVYQTNTAAFNLYQKLGFKKIAKLPNRIHKNKKFLSDILMERHI